MEKVLTTVAATIYDFTERYPERLIYLRGSDELRTRTYQRGIYLNYDEITKDFIVHGHIYLPAANNEDDLNYTEPFEKNKNYYGFFVIRK